MQRRKLYNETTFKHPPHSPVYFRRLSNFTDKEIRLRLDSYTKFLFVRHPFKRIVSAYQNKLKGGWTSLNERYAKNIIKKYRNKSATFESFPNVTFKEFADYIIDLPRSRHQRKFNGHWKSVFDICLPCNIEYDFIGKLETFQDDIKLLTNKTSLGRIIQEIPFAKPRSENLALEYQSQLTKYDLIQLQLTYELDYRLFDYPYSIE